MVARRRLLVSLELEQLVERTPEQCRKVASRLRARIEPSTRGSISSGRSAPELLQSVRQCERAKAEEGCCPVVLDLAGNSRTKREER